MVRTGLMLALLTAVLIGCSSTPPVSPVYWHEGEDFAGDRADAAEIVSEKPPASGRWALTGGAVQKAGDSVTYLCKIVKPIPNAKLYLRYSRNQWGDTPAKLDVAAIASAHRPVHEFEAQATLPNTGGWGAANKSDWHWAEVDLGGMPPWTWQVTFTAAQPEHNDLNLDGFLIAPAALAIDTDHIGLADRIHFDSGKYVGFAVETTAIRQDQPTAITLIGRGFVPQEERVTVRLAHGKGPIRTLFKGRITLDDKAITIKVPDDAMRKATDGIYYLTAEWASAPPMTIEVRLIGQLAGGFDERLDKIKTTLAGVSTWDSLRGQAMTLDYEHAVDYLRTGWEQVLAGTASPKLIDHIRMTLRQYERTSELAASGENPYEAQAGDLRLAFRSSTTQKLEPFRLILPGSYRPDGKTPVILALNGNEDRFLDRADVIKAIADRRGYAIISPRATSGYRGTGRRDLFQVIDVALERFSGLDPTRVYCTGPSAGGFATYNLATLRPERFAAIACANGAGNWRRFARPDRELIPRFSPVPTLILHGRKDPVVAATDIEQFAAELAKRGLTHEMHIFPTHGHSYMANAELYLNLTLDFFDRHTEPVAKRPRPRP